MELLGIPLFDDDFYKMIIRFLLNLFFLTAVVKYIYYKRSQKKEYLFTFYLVLIKLSILVQPLLVCFLKGKTYVDPIDGKSFRRFLPYGYRAQRKNVLSPSTLSLERHRLLWLYLESQTDFFTKPKKLLHFAPEQAFYKRFKKMKHFQK